MTSEHPVFINDRIDGKKEQIFVALPTLLIVFGRGEKGQFSISNLTKAEVAYFNKAIIKNNKYIISCSKTVEI
ncbi:hypothetical protein [Butyrivibrio hungatei]|uniref:hypothetical protein n=1 Tax=Butyrivibrio hungatei TaxID=185008 RepID=UPI0008DBEECC|nr:hypothetical protein [Butyrivibrio hungatei]